MGQLGADAPHPWRSGRVAFSPGPTTTGRTARHRGIMKAADIDRMEKGPRRDEAGRIYSKVLAEHYPKGVWKDGAYEAEAYYACRDKAHALASAAVDRFLNGGADPATSELASAPVHSTVAAPAHVKEPDADFDWDEAFAGGPTRDPATTDTTVDWDEAFGRPNSQGTAPRDNGGEFSWDDVLPPKGLAADKAASRASGDDASSLDDVLDQHNAAHRRHR